MASRGAFFMTGVFSFFINLLMLTAPLYMLQIYDRVLSSRSESTLVALTVLAGGMLLVMGLLDLIRSRVLVRVGSRLDDALNQRVFSAIFQRSLRIGRGERSQPLRDLDSLRQFLTGPGPFAFFDAPWVPLYLLVVFLFHPLLGLIALGGAVILFGIALANELLTRKPLQQANAEVLGAYAFAETSLRNAEVLEAMGMLEGIRRRWVTRHQQGLALQTTASDRAGSLTSSSKAIRMFLQVAILGVGAWLAIQQIITPGVMIAASIIMGRALAPIEQAIGHWRQFVGARSAYRRLDALLAESPAAAEHLALPQPEGYLAVEQVVVVPPGAARPVLKGLAFKLAPGEALGVIGPSASGKSSLARLLVGVWPPAAGAVRLDGAELHAWDREQLGPFVGYLPQDVELFTGTVAENIARFADQPDPDQVVEAARRAGVHEMVLQLSEGYDTEIGENGSVLSGGQRQRIGLARALYGSPALVVLDEPNSNLDAAGDQALTAAILELKSRNATVVVMAHRPSAISAVDKLLMLRDGKIEAFGPKEEVLAQVTRAPAPVPSSNVTTIRPSP
jgi:PrtD family type I secretion system ABC transporter